MRVALVHDYLTQLGGAERVLLALSRIFPDASIYTLLYDAEKMGERLAGRDIRPSFLNKPPAFIRKRKRWLLPLFPLVVSALDLSEYDLIISSSSAFSKGVHKKNGAVHICYCHSPTRFLWDYKDNYRKENSNGVAARLSLRTPLFDLLIYFLRKWDKASARRVDFWIANSETIRARIKKYYGEDATVVYPPLADLRFRAAILPAERDYFLIVARLSAYKKIDIVIEAFNELGWPLIIVGDGPERKRLEKMSDKNIKFPGFVSDEELAGYYAKSTAFILANEEDFGLAALEAASFGKPILAWRRGGVMEWLGDGEMGEFFDQPEKEAVKEGARKMFDKKFGYDSALLKKTAESFGEEIFKDRISFLVKEVFKNRRPTSL